MDQMEKNPNLVPNPNQTSAQVLGDDVSELTQLGSRTTEYLYDGPNALILETFPNKQRDRDYNVEFVFPEFTSLCPKTGQPDFATIKVNYVPAEKCIETKSFKLYMFAFRNCGSFMETITNKILADMVEVCKPKYMEVVGFFNSRGGVQLNVTAVYHAPEVA